MVQNEEVEVCNVQLVPDCEQQGPEECELVYDTVCTNKRREHKVIEDVVTCNTVYEESCEGEKSNDTGELESSSLNVLYKGFLAAKAQLNTCTCLVSVCPSVVKTEFLPVYTSF